MEDMPYPHATVSQVTVTPDGVINIAVNHPRLVACHR